MSKKYVYGLILCLIAVLSWGGMFPVMAPALKIMDPFYFTLLRYGSVAIIFAIILLIVEGSKAFKTEGHAIKLWVFGTAAFAGFSFLVFLGQQLAGQSGSIIASVMMAIQPLLGVLVGWLYRGAKPTVASLISMVIAAIGVFMVVTKGHISVLISGHNTLLAVVFILFGALCWVVYTAGGADFPEWSILRYSTLTAILGVCSVIGAINGILFMNLVPIVAFVITIINGYKVSAFEIIGCLITISALIGNNIYNRYVAHKKLNSKI